MRRAKRPAVTPMQQQRLKFMTCGSVDDGKSTLIGRLLVDSGAVYEDHMVEARRAGGSADLDFSFLVDGLKAEREQGITIDVAYRYFATMRRSFLIADAPGHEQYTRNQAAAASQTDLAVVLVSADHGVQPQTRRHMAIASLFGITHVVFAINKMDKVGRQRRIFQALDGAMRTLAGQLKLNVVASIPVSARAGDNVVTKSPDMGWYKGPTILEALETFQPQAQADTTTVLPVQTTGRLAGGGRVSFGELTGGTLSVGQRLISDTRLEAEIQRLWVAGTEAAHAVAGQPVAIELKPELDLGRGAVLFDAGHARSTASQLRARFIWLSDEPLRDGRMYDLQIGTTLTTVTIPRVTGILDLATLGLSPAEGMVTVNDIAVAQLNVLVAAPALPFSQSEALGTFILIDKASRQTVAAGIVLSVEKFSADTPWQVIQVTPEARAARLAQKPLVIWLTGLSGAGKSTIAELLDRRLHAMGRHTCVLDGDNLRQGLNADLGFSEGDRVENIRRVGHVAALMADAGLIVIVSLISPIKEARRNARMAVGDARFIEVFVDAPLEVCQQRDPKGMYARAMQGDLKRFTGIAAGYDVPDSPDLHIRTDQISAGDAVDMILQVLETHSK